jgi:AraC family transcriptional regulator
MADESAVRAMSCGLLAAQEQGMHSMSAMIDANESICLMPSGAERLGYLLRRAIQLMETDVQAASRYLRDASTLLSAESRRTAGYDYEVPRFRPGGLARWQTKCAADYIENNLGSKIEARELANLFSFSKSHFSRAFKRTFGVPPMTYVFARRVERAKLMLTGTRDQLTDIALSCGFADQSHLTRAFRRVVGMSPGLWRRTATDSADAKAGVSS